MSIPSPASAFRIPDFRNQGVWLRVLLAANGLLALIVVIRNRQTTQLVEELLELAALAEPALLLALTGLFILAPWFAQQRPAMVRTVVIGWSAVAFAIVDGLLTLSFAMTLGWRAPLAGGLGAAVLLAWFECLARGRAPALAEARLAALNARIRPHFLFNSLNAILGVIREDPQRAEKGLEELAELFRMLLKDNRTLVPLSEEIALARRYLAIEKLRLGERLQVRWEMDGCPPDLLAPPLMLQPLLENAVYHGVETQPSPGEVVVHIDVGRERVRIEIENPVAPAGRDRPGNRIALDNLRERLLLFYDLEARLEAGERDGRFHVVIDLPRRESS